MYGCVECGAGFKFGLPRRQILLGIVGQGFEGLRRILRIVGIQCIFQSGKARIVKRVYGHERMEDRFEVIPEGCRFFRCGL